MKLQSGESVTIDILGSVSKLFWDIVAQVFWFMAFVVAAALAPVILVALPLYLIWQNPHQHLSWLGQTFFWTAPLSCGFYVLIYSQWSSAMVWQRMGRLHQWREDHGGFLCTIPRACGWLLFGIVGSFLCEVTFAVAFRFVPHCESRLSLWMALFPFAAYSPLVPTWLWRRWYV